MNKLKGFLALTAVLVMAVSVFHITAAKDKDHDSSKKLDEIVEIMPQTGDDTSFTVIAWNADDAPKMIELWEAKTGCKANFTNLAFTDVAKTSGGTNLQTCAIRPTYTNDPDFTML